MVFIQYKMFSMCILMHVFYIAQLTEIPLLYFFCVLFNTTEMRKTL